MIKYIIFATLLLFSPTVKSITIQAETYQSMFGVIPDNPTLDINGGINMGSFDANDWIQYAPVTVATSATYTFTYRVAGNDALGKFAIYDNDVLLDTISVPYTKGWQSWTSVIKPNITLSSGQHTFKIVAISRQFNLNWFTFDLTGQNTVVPDFPSSAASSTATTTSSSKASIASSIAASSSSSINNTGSVTTTTATINFKWAHPTQRENGDTLPLSQIGGYEFRYRTTIENTYKYLTLPANSTLQLTTTPGTYIFQIAAFDTDGLYSNFVNLTPTSSSSSSRKFIAPPTNGSIE